MKKQSIKNHLKDYSIYQKRWTTINHAFAAALSAADEYNERAIEAALKILGQDPSGDLTCVYCDKLAETWDHVSSAVVLSVVMSDFNAYHSSSRQKLLEQFCR